MATFSKWLGVGFSYLRWPFEAFYIRSQGGTLTVDNEIRYYFLFCGKWLTIPKGFEHDHFSWSPNLPRSIGGICHDYAFAFAQWDDGTKISFAQSRNIMRDILRDEGWPRLTVAKYVKGVNTVIARGMWQKYRERDGENAGRFKALTGRDLTL